MTKVSLKDGKSIICERCGNWHTSKTDHKKHLRTTCNANLRQIERDESSTNSSFIEPSSTLNQTISNNQRINQQQTSTSRTNLNSKFLQHSSL